MNLNRFMDFILGVPLIAVLSLFFKKKEYQGKPRKILIIKLAAIGDTLILIPVLKSLREKHPELKIDWLVSPINYEVAKNVSYVDDLVVWNRKISTLGKVISLLRSRKYDVVFDLEQWSRGSALLAFFTGASALYGFSAPGQYRDTLFTAAYKKLFLDHEIYDFYHVFSLWDDLERKTELEIKETPQGINQAADVLEGLDKKDKHNILVLIHPGCGADGLPREWPLTSYAVLANWLMKKYQAKIILTGGPEERKKSNDLNRLLNNKALNLGGSLSLEGLVSLVKRVDLVISGNTGIMHMAAAHKKNQIAIHGPTNSKIWGPLNPNAKIVMSPCPLCPCLKLGFEYHTKNQSCMNKIDVDQVKCAAIELLENRSGQVLL